jgi:acetyl-CoA carboxylase beta subunit
MFDPISKMILDQIKKAADEEKKVEVRGLTSGYWVKCPSCGKKVVKRQILAQGCWACGWKGKEIELARAKRASGHETTPAAVYKTGCPQCGRLVITKELTEKGCYICGWRG